MKRTGFKPRYPVRKTRPVDPHVESRICAYCGKPASTRDHVVPKSYPDRDRLPAELRATVSACSDCNLSKGTLALIPVSWLCHIEALTDAYPSRKWRTWNGDKNAPEFREVWI
jgi:5-methylcytosine-specific restriction endonuclease McrA